VALAIHECRANRQTGEHAKQRMPMSRTTTMTRRTMWVILVKLVSDDDAVVVVVVVLQTGWVSGVVMRKRSVGAVVVVWRRCSA
jgi:hypothetical protein